MSMSPPSNLIVVVDIVLLFGINEGYLQQAHVAASGESLTGGGGSGGDQNFL